MRLAAARIDHCHDSGLHFIRCAIEFTLSPAWPPLSDRQQVGVGRLQRERERAQRTMEPQTVLSTFCAVTWSFSPVCAQRVSDHHSSGGWSMGGGEGSMHFWVQTNRRGYHHHYHTHDWTNARIKGQLFTNTAICLRGRYSFDKVILTSALAPGPSVHEF